MSTASTCPPRARSSSPCARTRTSTSSSGASGRRPSSSTASWPAATCSASRRTRARSSNGSRSRAAVPGSSSTRTCSCRRAARRSRTSSASLPPHASGGVLDRDAELHLRLAHPPLDELGGEALQQRLGQRAGERLEQVEARPVGELADQRHHFAVVDGRGELVALGLGKREPDVVEERLRQLALFRLGPV